MGITALAAANLTTPLLTPGNGTADANLTDALPVQFASLLAQLGDAQVELPEVSAADEVEELAKATEPRLDNIDQLIQNAQPYLAPPQEKSADNKVDRKQPTEAPLQASDTALMLGAALTANTPQSRSESGKPPSTDERLSAAIGSSTDSPNTMREQNAGDLQSRMGTRNSSLPPSVAQPAHLSITAATGGSLAGTSETQANQTTTANIAVDSATQPATNSFATTLGSAQATHAQGQSQPTHGDIATPLHESQWSQNFSEKIVWLAKSEQQVAQININPPQLGPIQINLNVSGDQASAVFTSPHAEVRQAIEDAMPRLREMLNGAGISLGQANVGAQLPQQNRETPAQFANGARFSGETAILPGDSNAAPGAVTVHRGRGLVDLFA